MSWVVDVSYANGVVDWRELKEAGVVAAYIRAGYGTDLKSQDDVQLPRNVLECKRLNIPYGLYLYSYADTEKKAESEAAHIIRLAKMYKPILPIYYDVEETLIMHRVNKNIEIMKEKVEDAGYKFGVYASLSWWNNLINTDVDHKWIAHWAERCGYHKPCDLWQTGTIQVGDNTFDHNLQYPNVNKYRVKARSGLRLRSEPSTVGISIGTLAYNTPVEIEKIEKGWAKVTAYVSAKYIDKEG